MKACLTHARVSAAVRKLGVNAPEIIAVEDLGDALPVPVIISRFIHGACLSPGDASIGVWQAVGAQLARLHAATVDQIPPGLRTVRSAPPGGSCQHG